MVGIRSFPIGARPIFSGKPLVTGSVRILPPKISNAAFLGVFFNLPGDGGVLVFASYSMVYHLLGRWEAPTKNGKNMEVKKSREKIVGCVSFLVG